MSAESRVPAPVQRAMDAMEGFPGEWAPCGGWSVDAWLGRQTRDHPDVDVAVFEDDQLALRDHFARGWLLNGHDPDDDDSTTPWTGRRLALPAHIHARAGSDHLDFQLNRGAGGRWVFWEQPNVELPVSDCVKPSRWSAGTLVPEAVLFYKAVGEINQKDAADFALLLPALSDRQREWLRRAVQAARPGHPWITALSGADR